MVFISLVSESAFLNKDSEIVKLIYADLTEEDGSGRKGDWPQVLSTNLFLLNR